MLHIPFLSAIELGLIYGIVALGVYLTFRVINFPDLTVDGTFPLGACLAATLLTQGVSPIYATLLAVCAGMLAGCITALLHVRLHIMGLLASILTMTALYSVNIRIMGRPNIALFDVSTLFTQWPSVLSVMSCITLFILLLLILFLHSQYGLGLRASGMNAKMSRAYGVNVNGTTILALSISNGMVALAGALFAQAQGFADVSLGTGTIISGLASVIIGEAVLGTHNVTLGLCGCILGAILYRIAISAALGSQFLGLQASDLNLMTTILIIIILILPQLRVYIRSQRGKLL